MIEHEWLDSDDPAPMVEHVKTLPGQQQLLTMWVRECDKSVSGRGARLTKTLGEKVGYWGKTASKPYRQQAVLVLREIVGNPFRPITLCPHRYETTTGGERRHVFDCPDIEEGYHAPNCVLSNSDVVNIARTIREGEVCGKCGGEKRLWDEDPRPWLFDNYTIDCDKCHGTGRLSPRFQDMPILADALEEAGCEEEEILMHCRGLERCPCLGRKTGNGHPYFWQCSMCDGTGWRPMRGEHVRDCWVLRLLWR